MSELYGLLGEKLSHSVSPQIHSKIFNKLGMKGYYHLFEVESRDLKAVMEGFKVIKPRGINVTIPYKIKVMEFLDDVSTEAKAIGAVNTIKFENGKTIGYNTDYFGIGMLFNKNDIQVGNKKATIFGNGGVAVAMVNYLLNNGISEITVVTRNVSKLKENSSFKSCRVISYDEIQEIKEPSIAINCTPLGMYPNLNNSPIEKKYIGKFTSAVDMIYNPKETLFLKYAKEAGLKAVNGLYMLVGQATCAQEIWNNIKIPKKTIDEIYEELGRGVEN
ncbi:shikimate dehydrogenase [Clostridium estertheticum]|uniref:Shikimate dehydrogenase (NADP(+)) n=2 Tax=Clostridium estertheticum TaxID=238834 RepID=A0A1J0GHP1_9CLOT|nr:shikimate dehydrogenase [Clostridium estertheticum]APC40480.1 shikimate dehydrogenase [Clostridium estertheticum subsp. estertheticum]MBU3173045.1 shikimate dehydrogenase [Clostridium estertheticum]MBU3185769.1 shikimate dehydrogenase [Clostridium estertheticum]MBZ9617693.1 shikimate dehydrogenase [Clostridium estertheticum subsp. laramiense]MPQ31798.1 shikimate dehydrogenase [Clostridium estertheticum]